MKRMLFFLLMVLPALLGRAQDEKGPRYIQVQSTVIDIFTGYGLGDATVEIYDEEMRQIELFRWNNKPAGSGIVITIADRVKDGTMLLSTLPRKAGRYLFRISCKGYKTLERWHDVKILRRMTHLTLPAFELQKDFDEEFGKETGLGEVEVKATKIQFYHKGDTLVYNATAFNLPQGSMLDDLIRQLPGATINDDGEIRVNGRKIDMLTLNGKQFFGNNNRLMLDNLPYYTLDQVKVFDQSTERSRVLGHDVEEKIHTMDVRLKKVYSVGYLGNATLAAGTRERWLGRAFGLRFTDNSRLSFFLNNNNVNESRKPGSDASWKPSDLMSGLQQTHRGGVDLNIWDNYSRYEDKGFITAAWNKTEHESRTAGESFLNEGTAYSRALSEGRQRNLALELENEFTLKKPWYVKAHTKGAYSEYRNRTASRSAQFSADPDAFGSVTAVLDSLLSATSGEELRRITVNRTTSELLGRGRNGHIGQEVKTLKSLPWGDDFEATATVNYRTSTARDRNTYLLDYPHDPSLTADRRNRYNHTPAHSYDYAAHALYRFNFLSGLRTELRYGYSQTYSFSDERRYRLEQLASPDAALGTLPSTLGWMQEALDAENSKTIGSMQKRHTLAGKVYKTWTVKRHDLTLDINLPLEFRYDRMRYSGAPLDSLLRRSLPLFNPSVQLNGNFRFAKWQHRSALRYEARPRLADLLQMAPVRNTYNPLARQEGNPDLKSALTHEISLNINHYRDRLHMYNLLGISFRQDEIAMGYTYNPATGVYRYRPQNVSGNRNAWFHHGLSSPLGKAKRWTFEYGFTLYHDRQTDLCAVTTAPQATTPVRSRVDNLGTRERLKFSYSSGKLRVSAAGEMHYRHTASPRPDFRTLDAFDYNYGLNGQYTLPFGLSLATDVKMYSRRGYGSSAMNADDLVWNASLSQPFLKEKLTLTLQAFDLLHQLSQTTYTVNAQGRTETWQRSLPNYLMLHLQWRFNVNPKGKKK